MKMKMKMNRSFLSCENQTLLKEKVSFIQIEHKSIQTNFLLQTIETNEKFVNVDV
jgi:hypothetical protein